MIIHLVGFAGTAVAVDENVTEFKLGDDVFGGRGGAFAEFILVPEDRPYPALPILTFDP